MSPVPDPQVEPADGTQVQVAPESAAGSTSTSRAAVAADGPVLRTVTV